MPKSSKMQLFGAKIETAQNTAATLTPTDYCLVDSASVKPVPEFIKREYKHTSLSQLASILGTLYVEIAVKVPLKGTATPGTPLAPLSALVQACSLIETISAGVSTTYAFASATIASFFGMGKSCTISVYEAGPSPLYHSIKGCVAKSAKITMKAGGIAVLDATFEGLYTAPTDTAFPSATFTESVKEPILQSSSLSVQTFAAIVSSIEIDFGLGAVLREDSASPYGVKGFAVMDRKVSGSVDPEVENVATHDFFGKMLSGATGALTFVLGATAGNIFSFSLPTIQYRAVEYSDRGSIKTFKVPFDALQSSGDDEFSLVIT